MIEFGSRVRLDYQPLFGKMSPHSSPPPPHLSSGRIKDCTHAWKKWPQRKGTRRRHTRREGASAREAHENHFYWLFESVESFYWLRGPIWHEIHISGSGDRQKICLIIDQRKYSLFRKNFTACIERIPSKPGQYWWNETLTRGMNLKNHSLLLLFAWRWPDWY